MTPHYGPYYQSGEVPGDWHSPTPIEFLAVGEGQSWQTGIIPVRSFDGDTEQLLDSVYEALEVAGLGSKTSVGYGRFNRDIQAEEDMKYHLDELRKQETADKALNQQLQGKSPDLQELIRRSLDEGWIEPGKGFPVKEIEEYLEEKGTLSRDCIEWIVENYISKDLWEHPDAVKKNGKLKYKPNQSQMVVSLKKLLDDC